VGHCAAADGKLIVGGDFQTVRGLARRGIARLNADGSGDPTFNPGSGVATTAYAVAVQPDGKVLMGGYNLITRLKPDGSLDNSFDPGTGPDYLFVYDLALQSDGKVLIGGNFTTVNGTNRNRIARLNSDGSLDSGFDPGTGPTTMSGLLPCSRMESWSLAVISPRSMALT